jgi:hypothetical protein
MDTPPTGCALPLKRLTAAQPQNARRSTTTFNRTSRKAWHNQQ